MIITKSQHGFSLVELMVALAIGLFLTGGMIQIFITTNQTNRTQENLSRMQENARFAMHFLIEDIRQAGYSSLVCGEKDVLSTAYNHLDSSSAIYDFSNILDQAVSGVDDAPASANGSDSISLSGFAAMGTGFSLQSEMATKSSAIEIMNGSGLPQYGIALVTDCSFSDIFEITHNPDTGAPFDQIKHVGGAVAEGPGNVGGMFTAAYGINARVYYLARGTSGIQPIIYTVKNDGQGVPGLTQNSQQIVANIENIQILYGERLASGNMYYVPAGTAGLDMTKVVSVKVSLLVRSPDDNVLTDPQTYFFNDASTVATDNRLRKVYTSTITLRNRLN